MEAIESGIRSSKGRSEKRTYVYWSERTAFKSCLTVTEVTLQWRGIWKMCHNGIVQDNCVIMKTCKRTQSVSQITFLHFQYNVLERRCEKIPGRNCRIARKCFQSTFNCIVMQRRKVICKKDYWVTVELDRKVALCYNKIKQEVCVTMAS